MALKLKVGEWYYFTILGSFDLFKIIDEKEDEYITQHFVSSDDISLHKEDRDQSYVMKNARSIHAYNLITQHRIIQRIFTFNGS